MTLSAKFLITNKTRAEDSGVPSLKVTYLPLKWEDLSPMGDPFNWWMSPPEIADELVVGGRYIITITEDTNIEESTS